MGSQPSLANEILDGTNRKGAIIMHDGTKIKGMLIGSTNKKMALSISFRPEGAKEIVQYTPKDIKGFQILKGSTFYSFEIKLQNGTMAFRFLKRMHNGNIKFYEYKSYDGDFWYVLKEYQLIELRKIKSEDNPTYEYINTLRRLTADCGHVNIKNDLIFTAPIIIRNLRVYDDCKELKSTGLTKKERKKANRINWDAPFRFSGYVGVPFSTNGKGTIHLVAFEYNLKSNPLKSGQSIMLSVYKVNSEIDESRFLNPFFPGPQFPTIRTENDFGVSLKYRLTFKSSKKLSFTSALGILTKKTFTSRFDTTNNDRVNRELPLEMGFSFDVGLRYAFNKRHEIRLELSSGTINSIQLGYAAAFHE